MSKEDDVAGEIVLDVLKIKKQKTVLKAKLTRCAHSLTSLLDEEDVTPYKEIKSAIEKHAEAKDAVVAVLLQLIEIYESLKDLDKADKSTNEIDAVLEEYKSIERQVQLYISSNREELSVKSIDAKIGHWLTKRNETKREREQSPAPSRNDAHTSAQNICVNNDSHQSGVPPIGQDMWRQLERVSVPKFTGAPSAYPSWKAAFCACVDNAPATSVYKLLQLKQCLQGEPLRLIECLGHSAEAYDAAKECLERKYGGERRLIAIHLNELENFRPIKDGQTKGLEKFSDLLNVTIVNLKEAGRHNDLKSVSFHSRLQQKLPASLLIEYRRWLQENNFNESVEALCDFVLRETEFRSIAKETLNGFGKQESNQQKYSH